MPACPRVSTDQLHTVTYILSVLPGSVPLRLVHSRKWLPLARVNRQIITYISGKEGAFGAPIRPAKRPTMRTWFAPLFKCLRLPRMASLDGSEQQHVENIASVDDTPLRARLHRVISEDDDLAPRKGVYCASAAMKADDVHTWMREEDERREELFRSTERIAKTAHRRRTARKCKQDVGASISFQIARRATTNVYSCGACGALAHAPQLHRRFLTRASRLPASTSSPRRSSSIIPPFVFSFTFQPIT